MVWSMAMRGAADADARVEVGGEDDDENGIVATVTFPLPVVLTPRALVAFPGPVLLDTGRMTPCTSRK